MAKKPQGYTAPDTTVGPPKIPIAPGSSNTLGQAASSPNPASQATPNAMTIQPGTKPPAGPGTSKPGKKPPVAQAKRGGKSPKKDGAMMADNMKPDASAKKPFSEAAPPFKKPPVKLNALGIDSVVGSHGGLDHDLSPDAPRRYRAQRYSR